LLLPLSGANAAIGRELLDAAQLALFDLADDRLTLMPRDTQGTPAGAATAAEAVLAEGAELIVGPLFSSESAAVAPIAQGRGVNVISFSNDRSVAGNGVFILGFTPEQEIEQVIGFARSRGYARFAALTPESPYGNAVLQALRRTLAKVGGEAAKIESYPTDVADLAPIVRRFAEADRRKAALAEQKRQLSEKDDEISRQALKRLEGIEAFGDVGFDALLLPEGGARLKALAPLLALYDVDPAKVRFLGSGLWDEPGLGREPNLVGGWLAATPQANSGAFRVRFQKAFGRTPPRIASLGYDAAALAAVLSQAPQGTPFTREAIANPNGFAGYDGIFRFGPDGVAERGLAILEVAPREFKVVRPAPESFENFGQ
jgi:ABC-type branched-subunit amino acid transport system substrate-binding protein